MSARWLQSSKGVGLGLLLFFGFFVIQSRLSDTVETIGQKYPTHAFTLGNSWTLEFANTPTLRARGLGERDSLLAKTGMLFVFEHPDRHGFWMKGMRFPIDIIFLFNGRVVSIERMVQPGDMRIVRPPEPINQVLEVNAGEAADLAPGERVWYWRGFR